ncbi:MAG: spermidine/putrescine ABC transporter substrate-binding protein [Oscillospiraceae bacterium]|nr:spermidine/putrescine ABC transporter substrate-binding protein [Oscillospiraceae bacterium]
MKLRNLAILATGLVLLAVIVAKQSMLYNKKNAKISINVSNWGEFMSNGSNSLMNVNYEFEKLTGVHVNYTTVSSNEEAYAKIKGGGVSYDVVILSDYMIARMIAEKRLAKLNYANIPNIVNIMPNLKKLNYDPTGEYSVAYAWGTVGIVYNSKEIKEEVDGFNILWDEKFKNEILMFSNPRDAFAIALRKLNISFNTRRKEDILAAAKELKKQKHLIQAYVMDEIFDKMQTEEALIAPYYSGDVINMMNDNQNLKFVFPKEGTNRFVDAACIPINAKYKEAAELYINFLCEPGVALNNALYGNCSTPNIKAFDLLPENVKNNKVAYPDEQTLKNTQSYQFISTELEEFMDSLWVEIMVADENNNVWVMPVFIFVCAAATISLGVLRSHNKRQRV